MERAVFFDMDGVLVDVSHSYFTAIKKTAEHFTSENITSGEIQQYKNEGGYNDDWDLTEAIILSRGIKIDKKEIIRKFQSFYVGKNFDGLINHEDWLLKENILKRLKTGFKTGIITGRPREEAEYTLSRFNMEKYFDLLVAMEDVPCEKRKPHPFGIRKAMKRFDVREGAYMGDNIDDMKAAAGAGLVPVGVLCPDSSESEQKELLIRSGAKFVLDSINNIEELLNAKNFNWTKND